jgi:two-component system, sensor histidine kinase YesM
MRRLIKKIRQSFLDWSLQKKMTVAFSLLVIIPMLLFGGYAYINLRRVLVENIESAVYDNVDQMALRINDHLAQYGAGLQSIVMNATIARIFEDKTASYYQRYSDMVDVYEPIVLAMKQLYGDFNAIGVYTDSPSFSERNDTVLSMTRIATPGILDTVLRDHGIHWFVDNHTVSGYGFVMKLQRLAPNNIVYGKMDAASVFTTELDNMKDYAVEIFAGDTPVYSSTGAQAPQDLLRLKEGIQTIGGKKSMLIRRNINAAGWTMCFYCSYSNFDIGLGTVLGTLAVLAVTCYVFLAIVGRLISRSVTSRVDSLNQQMEKVENGNLEHSPAAFDHDEIGELTKHFANMVSALRRHIKVDYENKLILRDAELKALQAQINPHFLYNTLSMINWKALEYNAMDISEIVVSLSGFYRSVLNQGKSEITVRNELENIKYYIDIQRYLHDNSFDVDMDIDPDMLNCRMTGIILQPIIENAIDHGIDLKRDGHGRLAVAGYRRQDGICFTVTDNGPGMTQAQFLQNIGKNAKGYGLKNVNDRLTIAYGKDYGISLDETVLEGTRIIILIPAGGSLAV